MNSTRNNNVYGIEKGKIVPPREMIRRRKKKYKDICIDATHLACRLELILKHTGINEDIILVVQSIPRILEVLVRKSNES